VAHACNPSYSGGRDQEDRGLKPGWANSSKDYLKKTHHKTKKKKKKPITKIGLVEWLKVKALLSSPSTAKKKKKKKKKTRMDWGTSGSHL
jgi:hypothetical protein